MHDGFNDQGVFEDQHRAAHSTPPRKAACVPSPFKAEVSMEPEATRLNSSNALSALDLPLALVPTRTDKGSMWMSV
ncbi:hypothetical protein H663_007965 [Limnohabitans planktonicus II-D5]|uniref:Uncharacterized protein n=1 Tax=Limnohabitans planktonicus II-D5 TaxID=1293045 RepID=A0A2T7UEZ5_9BURK|nr:hypothetical protein H663_007965 [Limnohabitans planktonicus II-D5]